MIERVLAVSSFLFLSISTALAGPLHDAAENGHASQAKQLLARGADANARDENGETALILAALGGYLDVVRVLIDDGNADIHARNKRGLRALHAAAYAGKVRVAELLIENSAWVDDSENFYHATPLILAAEEDQKAAVELLIAHGANVAAEERNGYTSLTQAALRRHWEVARILMQAGAACQPAELMGKSLHEECTKRQWLMTNSGGTRQ